MIRPQFLREYPKPTTAKPEPTPASNGKEPNSLARFTSSPCYCECLGLWLYGNVNLLKADLRHVQGTSGSGQMPFEIDEIEIKSEQIVLAGEILVCGIHNPAHQKAAIVPLRWGYPRIVVFSGGFYHHLGSELENGAFRAERLWRYKWDPRVDLAVSRRAPDKLPTFAKHNPTVDRLIEYMATRQMDGMRSPTDIWGRTLSPAQ